MHGNEGDLFVNRLMKAFKGIKKLSGAYYEDLDCFLNLT